MVSSPYVNQQDSAERSVFGDQVFYTISEQIAHQIKDDIFHGRLAVGESLKEQTMAQKYGVSRGPIRDAFKVLAKEGFLIAVPNVGVTVAPPPTPEVMQEIIRLRRHLERFALERVFDALTDEDRHEMDVALQKIHEACAAGDRSKLVNWDMAFHGVIIKKYDDRHLFEIWNKLVFRMMFNYQRLSSLEDSYREHHAILQAIRHKNVDSAVELLEKNIQ